MKVIKKAAPGAGNTESGKVHLTIQSLNENQPAVKTPSIPLWRIILAMRRARIDDSKIVASILNALRPEEGEPK